MTNGLARRTMGLCASLGILVLGSGCSKSSNGSACTKSIHCGLFLTAPTCKPGTPFFYSFGQALATPGAYTFALVSGSLPISLTLTPVGNQAQIKGTVDASLTMQDYPVTIRMTDSTGAFCDIKMTLKVDPAATDASTAAPSIVQQTMSATCDPGQQLQFVPSVDGPNATTWVLSTGTLPSGVSLDKSTGIVSGASSSAFSLQLQATDPVTNKTSTTTQAVSMTLATPGGSGGACGSTTCSGSAICVSSRSCIFSSICECSGDTTGTCADYVSKGGYNHPDSCSTAGSDCGPVASGNNPLCCPGLTCTNGTCKSGCP